MMGVAQAYFKVLRHRVCKGLLQAWQRTLWRMEQDECMFVSAVNTTHKTI